MLAFDIPFFLKYFILGISVSYFFAKLEIQIEGKNGWAANLPTWRINNLLTKLIPGDGKPLTGYHTYLWLFISSLLHSIFLFIPWTVSAELLLISLFIFILLSEDFYWFILNPHYGIGKFKRKHIPWHHIWIFRLPLMYWIALLIWISLLYLSVISA